MLVLGYLAMKIPLKSGREPQGGSDRLRSQCLLLLPILLQKSFWGEEQKSLEPLMRFRRDDVRDHIGSSKIDH